MPLLPARRGGEMICAPAAPLCACRCSRRRPTGFPAARRHPHQWLPTSYCAERSLPVTPRRAWPWPWQVSSQRSGPQSCRARFRTEPDVADMPFRRLSLVVGCTRPDASRPPGRQSPFCERSRLVVGASGEQTLNTRWPLWRTTSGKTANDTWLPGSNNRQQSTAQRGRARPGHAAPTDDLRARLRGLHAAVVLC